MPAEAVCGQRTRSGVVPRLSAAWIVLIVVMMALVAAASGGAGAATPSVGPVDMSNDGSIVVFDASTPTTARLIRRDVASGDELTLFEGRTFEGGTFPGGTPERATQIAISTDGAIVVFADAGGSLRAWASGTLTTVRSGLGEVTDLVVSPDGRFVGYSTRAVGTPDIVAHRLDRRTGSTVVIPSDGAPADHVLAISDSGGRLMILRGQFPVGQLGVFDISARTFTKATLRSARIDSATLTAGGSRVVFASPDSLIAGVAGGTRLYETDLATRLLRTLPVEVPLDDTMIVSRSGNVIVQASPVRSHVLHIHDRSTGTTRTVTVDLGELTGIDVTLAVVIPAEISDDGTAVRVSVVQCSAPGCGVLDVTRVVPTGIVDPAALVWAPDSRPLDDEIDRIYRAVLDRSVDVDGLRFWVDRRFEGMSALDMVATLLRSDEAKARLGANPTDDAMVTAVHQGLLGRQPTGPERSRWLDQVADGVTGPRLVLDITRDSATIDATATARPQSSDEARLIRLYRAVFGRFPDPAGYRYWRQLQIEGLRLPQMVAEFSTSPEFAARYGLDPEPGTLVDLAYRNVLGRGPDAAGRQYWMQRLEQGLTRDELLAAFVDSLENVLVTGTTP